MYKPKMYKPIFLLHMDTKILNITLVKKLEKIIPSVIQSFQSRVIKK